MKTLITALTLSYFSYDRIYSSNHQVYGYQLLQDIDYWGGDMFDVQETIPIKCIEYCAMVPACVLTTWFDEMCYIKNETTKPSPKEGAVTFLMYPTANESTATSPIELTPNSTSVENSTNVEIEVPTSIVPAPVSTVAPTTIVPAVEEPKKSDVTHVSMKMVGVIVTLISVFMLV